MDHTRTLLSLNRLSNPNSSFPEYTIQNRPFSFLKLVRTSPYFRNTLIFEGIKSQTFSVDLVLGSYELACRLRMSRLSLVVAHPLPVISFCVYICTRIITMIRERKTILHSLFYFCVFINLFLLLHIGSSTRKAHFVALRVEKNGKRKSFSEKLTQKETKIQTVEKRGKLKK